jgi:hypothetical protein
MTWFPFRRIASFSFAASQPEESGFAVCRGYFRPPSRRIVRRHPLSIVQAYQGRNRSLDYGWCVKSAELLTSRHAQRSNVIS